MRKPRKFLLGEAKGTNRYHVVSRVAGGDLVFDDAMKETFRIILLKQLKFSGLRALAWCFMGNHFHLLLEVPDKERELRGWTEEQVVGRLGVLRSELSTRMLLANLAMYRENGHEEGVAAIVERVKARLFDLSMFMKELKQKMTMAYNVRHQRRGGLWEGRFKSVLLEGGDAVRMVAAYIDLNCLRASGSAQSLRNQRATWAA